MLIEKYDLDIFTPPCEPGAERYAAAARLTTDISEVLPYLNATLRGAVYHRAANALTWKKGGHNIAFHAYEIATSNVDDREAAIQEIRGLVGDILDLPRVLSEKTIGTSTIRNPLRNARYFISIWKAKPADRTLSRSSASSTWRFHAMKPPVRSRTSTPSTVRAYREPPAEIHRRIAPQFRVPPPST